MNTKQLSYSSGISVILLVLGYAVLSPQQMLLWEALIFFGMYILLKIGLTKLGKDTRITLDNILGETLTTFPYFICLFLSILGFLTYVITFVETTSDAQASYGVAQQLILYIAMMVASILIKFAEKTNTPKSPKDFKVKMFDFAKHAKSRKGKREIKKLKQQCKECLDRKYVDWSELNKFEIRPFYFR